ncbi:MAG: hypothetical protein KDK70_03555 [Myxococcales bacterium]|nr:hypothetical protein [Myxococcales bacterium]
MALSPADEYEAGGHPEAARCWARVQGLSLNEAEVELVDALRLLYRSAQPLSDPTGFVPGGSLVFCGANVRIAGDRGHFYERWLSACGLARGMRTGTFSGSSHLSDVDQYEIRLDGCGCILVGKAAHPGVDGGSHTWFQSESHAATGHVGQSILHGLAWVDHKAHGNQQVGAFGYSIYSEKMPSPNNPLVTRPLPELMV